MINGALASENWDKISWLGNGIGLNGWYIFVISCMKIIENVSTTQKN